jgi:CheY-like chemotaxis protein
MRLELEPRTTAFPLSSTSDHTENPFAATSWDFDSLLKKGVAAAQSGDRDQARKVLSQASAINPASEDVWMWLASISDYPEELLAFLNRVLDINPDNQKAADWRVQTNSLLAKTFVQRALGARNDGANELANQYLDQAIACDETCESAWYWKASLAEDEEQKIEFFERVLSMNPDNSDAAEAIQRIQGSRVEASLEQARGFVRDGKFEEAVGILNILVEHESGEVRESALMIMVATAVGDDEKLALYTQVLEVNPENAEARNAAEAIRQARTAAAFEEARTSAAEGNGPKAVEILENLLAESPESVDAWLLISHLSNSLDEKVGALEKVLELDPENAAARSGLAFLALTFGSNKEVNQTPTETYQADEMSTNVVSHEDLAPVAAEVAAVQEEEEVFSDDSVEEFHPAEHTPESVEFSYRQTEEAFTVEEAVAFEQAEVADDADPAPMMPEAFEFPISDPQPAPVEETFRPESPRSVEEIFGAVENVASPENETVDSFSPFATRPLGNDPFAAEAFETPAFQAEEEPVFRTEEEAVAEPATVLVGCSFCSAANDPQAIECGSCGSTLTLTDLDRLLAGTKADKSVVQNSVTAMEAEWNTREFTSGEFVALSLGHFNLGNVENGFRYLQEASRLNPNDVILAGHVNTVAIRLSEMQRQSEIHQSMPKGKTILVVDDSPTVRKLISGKLEKSGHNVVCAVDGVDALAKLEEGMPDLVLLDITMPRMDGYEVCKQIRANPAGKNLPVVMISGKDGFFDKVRGRMAGTSGYVTKPFGPETLMKALETYLLPEEVAVN